VKGNFKYKKVRKDKTTKDMTRNDNTNKDKTRHNKTRQDRMIYINGESQVESKKWKSREFL